MQRQHILSCAIVFGAILVLSLIAVGVTHHPTSLEGSGSSLLRMDVALLLAYGVAGAAAWKQGAGKVNASVVIGGQFGLLLSAAGITNHLIEAFVPIRPFILIISPVLLALALLSAAGAAAWKRTRSLMWAVSGGVWCAIVGVLILLSFAISFNLFFSARVDWQLRDAFAASGMSDPAGFRVRNVLEASSEILVRMPLVAIGLALAGAGIHAWMSGASRRIAVAVSALAPLMFAVGTFALWHANAMERAARPPFVLSGVLLTGVALSAAYPIWSISTGGPETPRGSVNS